MDNDRDPLNLGRLPPLNPPADDWPVIEAALSRHFGRRRRHRTIGLSLAAAASLALAVGITVRQPGFDAGVRESESSPSLAQQTSPVGNNEGAVSTLIDLSQRLETQLRRIRSNAPLMPTSSVIYQVELEDLVAQVDDELSRNPESTDLWRQRVGLLLDLTRLYRNELRRESGQFASL